MTEATAQSTTQEKVEYALPILLDLCPTARDLLDLLVPVVAAALEQVKAEPDHVQEFFLRVTRLLDASQSAGESN